EQRSNNHDGANWTAGKTEGLARPDTSTHARAARPVRTGLTACYPNAPGFSVPPGGCAGRH
ncbi:hypothetical protein QMN58_32495, partial [Escherichia coli]|nr:hypothetical protein [Escherichia coli]